MGVHEMARDGIESMGWGIYMWAPKDSPAAGATRYGHGLTRRRRREKTGRRTRLWRYISGKFVELMFIETPGVVVEPRWRYHNF